MRPFLPDLFPFKLVSDELEMSCDITDEPFGTLVDLFPPLFLVFLESDNSVLLAVGSSMLMSPGASTSVVDFFT